MCSAFWSLGSWPSCLAIWAMSAVRVCVRAESEVNKEKIDCDKPPRRYSGRLVWAPACLTLIPHIIPTQTDINTHSRQRTSTTRCFCLDWILRETEERLQEKSVKQLNDLFLCEEEKTDKECVYCQTCDLKCHHKLYAHGSCTIIIAQMIFMGAIISVFYVDLLQRELYIGWQCVHIFRRSPYQNLN